MPKPVRSCVATLAALLLVGADAGRVAAQAPDAMSATADSAGGGLPTLMLRAPSVFGAWVAIAYHSEFKTRTGVPGHRNFYLANLRLAWPFGGDDPGRVATVSYFIDVIPAALSTDMPEYVWTSRCQPNTFCPGATPIPHSVYGFGVAPVGWALALGRGPARLTIEAAGGGLLFSRRIPDPLAARFNFTASGGPTLDLRMSPAQSLRIGYLWHHTSNGGTARVNPGLNSGILTAGVLWHARPRS